MERGRVMLTHQFTESGYLLLSRCVHVLPSVKSLNGHRLRRGIPQPQSIEIVACASHQGQKEDREENQNKATAAEAPHAALFLDRGGRWRRIVHGNSGLPKAPGWIKLSARLSSTPDGRR